MLMNEYNRLRNNQKVSDFADEILKECEEREFTVADMKDLARTLPGRIDKFLVSVDENTKFIQIKQKKYGGVKSEKTDS